MKQFKIISVLLLMLALLVANRLELTIYEDGHGGNMMTHHEELHNHHEHVIAQHLHMEESAEHHHHHWHMVMDLDLVPCVRDMLLRFLLVTFVAGISMALILSFLHIIQLRSMDYPPWPGYPERVSRIGGAGYCRPMLN